MPSLNSTGIHTLYLLRMRLVSASGLLYINYLPIVGFGEKGRDEGKPFIFDATVMEAVIGESTITVDDGLPVSLNAYGEIIPEHSGRFYWDEQPYKTMTIGEFRPKVRAAFTP